MMRRRGPGLLRTAAIAGTATAVSGRVRKRQADKWSGDAQQAPQQAPQASQQAPAPPDAPAPPAPPAGGDDLVAQLQQLGELHSSGVLDDAEFEAAKAKLLAG